MFPIGCEVKKHKCEEKNKKLIYAYAYSRSYEVSFNSNNIINLGLSIRCIYFQQSSKKVLRLPGGKSGKQGF